MKRASGVGHRASVESPVGSSGVARVRAAFRNARDDGRAALIPFLVAGDPSFDATVELARAAVDAGADVIELGVPFSDPLADGPVIQAAYTRALAAGATVRGTLQCAARVAELGAPVVLMVALNPVLAFGVDAFCDAAARAGVSGVLVPDLPLEDADGLRAAAVRAGLGVVFLAAPDSGAERVRAAAAASTGFLYMVRRRGVTGAGGAPESDAAIAIARDHADVPIALGFGIATPADAAEAACSADGVIIGSALVDAAARAHEAGEDAAQVIRERVAAMAAAIRSVRIEQRVEVQP